MRRIYLDNAATTALDERVLKKMTPYFTEIYGNANSQHYFGREAMKAVDEAREIIAERINAKPSEIYFTSGGTEADNWALRGSAYANIKKGKHLIISSIEHAAMLSTAKELEKEGFEVTYLKVDEEGRVDLEHLKNSIRKDTTFIGVMYANNEIGTLQPVKEISEIARENKITFFTDAVQAAGALKIDVNEIGMQAMSFSAHKFHGPKGIGALYVKTGTKLNRLITGGHQERSQRGGTTNVPSVVGFAEAFRLACEEREKESKYVASLRDRFIDRVLSEIPFVKLNGARYDRLPNNADFSFKYIEGESILFKLDLMGIAVSSGSACSSGSLEPSHVLLAIGLDEETAHGSIRFTFGRENTVEEVDYVVDTLKNTVENLREISPLFKAVKGEERYV